jgi:hypothetical protein
VSGFRIADVTVRPVAAGEAGRFGSLLRGHHWLGDRLTGQVMRYVAEAGGVWVALIGFGSAALTCTARDRYIGWSSEQRYARLQHVVNNQRFCVLPEGRRPDLASAVLARTLRRLPGDYLAVHGHRALLAETFTGPARHAGTCYRAANFIGVGDTSGYARHGGGYRRHGRPKRVWVYPLHRDAARILSAPFPHPLLGNTTGGIDINTLPVTGDGGLLTVLQKLPDPRKKRGIRHPLATVLTIAAAAVLAGHSSLRSIGDFSEDLPQDALARPGARRSPRTGKYDAPGESTIRRTVGDIDANHADALIGNWLFGQVRAGRITADEVPEFIGLAVDGKTLKGSWIEENTGNHKVRLFSALVHGAGVIVGQRAIPASTTEVTQMLPLLDTIGRDLPPDSRKDPGEGHGNPCGSGETPGEGDETPGEGDEGTGEGDEGTGEGDETPGEGDEGTGEGDEDPAGEDEGAAGEDGNPCESGETPGEGDEDPGEGEEEEEEEVAQTLDGITVTADCLHVHRENLKGILKRGGNYTLIVKNNQPGLRAQLEKLFTEPAPGGSFSPCPHDV